MKTIIKVAAIGAVAYLVYKKTARPKFYLESVNQTDKNGVFQFGGDNNTFSLDKGGVTGDYNGYSVKFYTPDGVSYKFDLYKNGVFVENLETLWQPLMS